MPPFRILVVCTGNICRSPSAELLLRRGLHKRLGPRADDEIAVSSAGLGCADGWEMDPPVAQLLEDAGVAGWESLRSRAVTDALVADADLVLTATRVHRFRIGERWPSAYQHAFALGEVAALLAEGAPQLPGSTSDVGRALVDWLSDERSVRQVPDGYDLSDPHGGKDADYAEMLVRLQPMIGSILDALTPQRQA